MDSFPPYHCAVCGRCFANEHFHTRGGGDLVKFADYHVSDDPTRAPGVSGVAWICSKHLKPARERATLSTYDAIWDIRHALGVELAEPRERKPNPELMLVEVGANRTKVFAILHHATGLSPKEVRDLLDDLPARVSAGWPSEFEYWRQELCDAGAKVEILWD